MYWIGLAGFTQLDGYKPNEDRTMPKNIATKAATKVANTAKSRTTQNVIGAGTTTALFVAAGMSWLRANYPDLVWWEPGQDLVVGGIAAGVVTGFLSRLVSFWRNPDKTKRSAPIQRGLLFCVGLSVVASGCVGMAPAVRGKTKAMVDFTTNGEDITYKSELVAPAGVDAAELAAMSAGVDSDGAWQISVSQDTAADTTTQAAMLTEIGALQVQAYRDAFGVALNTLAPILGQYLEAQARVAEIEANKPPPVLPEIQPGNVLAVPTLPPPWIKR